MRMHMGCGFQCMYVWAVFGWMGGVGGLGRSGATAALTSSNPHTHITQPTDRPTLSDQSTHTNHPHTYTHTQFQQEEYIKDEMKNLKRELIRAKEEVKRIQVRTCFHPFACMDWRTFMVEAESLFQI